MLARAGQFGLLECVLVPSSSFFPSTISSYSSSAFPPHSSLSHALYRHHLVRFPGVVQPAGTDAWLTGLSSLDSRARCPIRCRSIVRVLAGLPLSCKGPELIRHASSRPTAPQGLRLCRPCCLFNFPPSHLPGKPIAAAPNRAKGSCFEMTGCLLSNRSCSSASTASWPTLPTPTVIILSFTDNGCMTDVKLSSLRLEGGDGDQPRGQGLQLRPGASRPPSPSGFPVYV